MPLYHGPLSSSPLTRKRERLTKVGHDSEWEEPAVTVEPPYHANNSPNEPPMAIADPVIQVPPQYAAAPPLYAPPVLTPMVVSPAAGGSPQYQAMPGPYPYAPWPPANGVPPVQIPPVWPGVIPSNPGNLSPPLVPMAPPLQPPPQPLQPQPIIKQARVVSAPPTPGRGDGAKFGRRRPQSTGDKVEEDTFFWRLGMGEGEVERKAAQLNARDRYKRDLERQIEERHMMDEAERRRRHAEDTVLEHQQHQQQQPAVPHPTAPGERTGRTDHSYARIRGQMFTDGDIERQKEKEQQARQLQHDLEIQIEERRRAKDMEERRRRENEEKWDAKYGGGGGVLKDKEAVEKDRVKGTIAMQEEAANALQDPKFAPLKKVYHHQRNSPVKAPQPPPPRPPSPAVQNSPPAQVVPVVDTGSGEGHVMSPAGTLPPVESERVAKDFRLSTQFKPVGGEGQGSADFGLKSFVRFKPPPVSYPDQKMVEQERRIAALESLVTRQVDTRPYDEMTRLTNKNKSRLMQLNDISKKIEMGGGRGTTEDILREFIAEAEDVEKVDKMFGLEDVEEPIWLRENQGVHVEQHEAFSGATLPGKSEWVERELEVAKVPEWLQEEQPIVEDDKTEMATTARTDAISIPATYDVDDNFLSKNFPVGARVNFKGQVGVIYRHSETHITIYLDSTGEVLETQPPDIHVIEYPPIKTSAYTPRTSAHSDPTPEPSIPVQSSLPQPVPPEDEPPETTQQQKLEEIDHEEERKYL